MTNQRASLRPIRALSALLVWARLGSSLATTTLDADVARGEWQHVLPVPGGSSPSRAYLWIPPDAHEVRGVVLAGMTLIEMPLVHDPIVRAAAAEAGLAIVFFHPHFDATFENPRSRERLPRTLEALARVSGYGALAQAPWITVGHSTGGIFARNVAYAHPARTAAVVHIKSGRLGHHLPSPDASLRGVPFLAINGQFEEFGPGEGGSIPPGETLESQWRRVRETLRSWRARDPEHLVSLLVEPGAGHFGWSETLARHVALFFRAVGQRRLGAPGQPLRPVRGRDGWLTDARLETAGGPPPCHARACPDDGGVRLWHLDRALAEASERLHRGLRGRRDQRVTFVDAGVAQPPRARMRIGLDAVGDGITFRVAGAFWDPGGAGHAAGPIRFRVLRGAAVPVGPDTFRVQPGAFGLDRHTRRVVILAHHPGDGRYRPTEQPADLEVPLGVDSGSAQTITFPTLADVPADSGPVPLRGRSSAGLPVGYYVEAGPAFVVDGTIRLTRLPPRTPFPVPVTVVAHQLGQAVRPLVAAASPVRRTFLVLPPRGRGTRPAGSGALPEQPALRLR